MSGFESGILKQQNLRNKTLLENARYMGDKLESEVIPFHIDIENMHSLSEKDRSKLEVIAIQAARTAVQSLASLAQINELDHLGGALDLIPALTLTLALTDYEKIEYTIENAHTSIGYYAALAAYGYLDQQYVADKFRRSLDIAGHVSWVPGGTQLNGGRLGVMIPVSAGQALAKKAVFGEGAWVITHCGDAGWISGQALNGFNAADLHGAPLTFVMNRNGIQLSGSNRQIMDKDPRPVIESLGITIFEIPSLHDTSALFMAYREAYLLAKDNRPSLIYPAGYISSEKKRIDLNAFGHMYGIEEETKKFAAVHNVPMDLEIWVPGSLMSFRDVVPMLECLFLVNNLAGGKGHHDGHMKGRDEQEVLGNPMLKLSTQQEQVLNSIYSQPKRKIVTASRPLPGTPNLQLPDKIVAKVDLPGTEKDVSPRAGAELGYAAVAEAFPESVFVVSCDLDASTKLSKARSFLSQNRQFEMSIEEQASALLANGLAMNGNRAQLNVFSTFGAFFEGIAREGFELWRYQRNLNGINEGINVTFHISHVGACTGRDHFSGWSLDWINLALGYLPYLHRFYAPADARSAFLAVKDLAAHYGGHIIGIPRDNLPVLKKQDGSGPFWTAEDSWSSVQQLRVYKGSQKAILAFGAPAFIAIEAAESLNQQGIPTDVYIINGLPLDQDVLHAIFQKYSGGLVTVEDGIIASRPTGLRGFGGLIASAGYGFNIPVEHIGITDPRTAPSDGHMEVWEHFGITSEAIVEAIQSLK